MAGLFGPQSSVTSSHIQSICDTLEIPHIETRWDYRMKRDDYSVNLYPHPHALGQVCQIEHFGYCRINLGHQGLKSLYILLLNSFNFKSS